MKKSKIFVMCAVICTACTHVFSDMPNESINQRYEEDARKQLDAIDSHDGISRNEAKVIFEVYGYRFFINNGWGSITDGGENWLGSVLDHWSDQPLPHKVKINKKTGAVSWEIGPDILDYKALLDTSPNNRSEYAPDSAGPR